MASWIEKRSAEVERLLQEQQAISDRVTRWANSAQQQKKALKAEHKRAKDNWKRYDQEFDYELPFNRYTGKASSYGTPFVAMDLETAGLYKGAAVNQATAFRLIKNNDTGELEVMRVFNRYYETPKNQRTGSFRADYETAMSVSGLYNDRVKELKRRQLYKQYGRYFDTKEALDLWNFFGKDPVVGFNSNTFDLPHVLGVDSGYELNPQYRPAGGAIDILQVLRAGRGEGREGFNKLENVFKQFFPEEVVKRVGRAHDARGDIARTALLYDKMAQLPGRMGKSIRLLQANPGWSTREKDSYLTRELSEIDTRGTPVEWTIEEEQRMNASLEDQIRQIINKPGDDPINYSDLESTFEMTQDQLDAIDAIKPKPGTGTGFGAIDPAQFQQALLNIPAIQQLTEAYSSQAIYHRMAYINAAARLGDRGKAEEYLAAIGFRGNEAKVLLDESDRLRTIRQVEKDVRAKHAGIDKVETFLAANEARFGREQWYKDIKAALPDVSNADEARELLLRARSERGYSVEGERKIKADNRAAAKAQSDWDKASAWADKQMQGTEGFFATMHENERRRMSESTRRAYNTDNHARHYWGLGDDESDWAPKSDAYSNLSMDDSLIRAPNIDKSVSALDKFKEALNSSTKSLNSWQHYANRMYDFDNWRKTAVAQSEAAVQEAQPLFVGPLRHLYSPSARIFKSFSLATQSAWDRQRAIFTALKDTGMAVGAAIGSVAGPVGSLVGGTVGAGVGFLSNAIGNYGQRKIQAKGEEIRSQINAWGGWVELMAAPLKLVTQAAQRLAGAFNTLVRFTVGGLNLMQTNVGLPLTGLTGMNYGGWQDARGTDRLLGLSAGTTYNTLVSHERAAQGLYSLGQVDTTRLVSAAVLGQFDNVYNPNGDTKANYNAMVNGIYANYKNASAEEKANIMYHAGNIDSALPTVLQEMENLGVGSYDELAHFRKTSAYGKTGDSMFYRDISDEERNKFNIIGYDWGTAKAQFDNSKMRISAVIWEKFGRNLVDGLNQTMDMISQGDYKGAFDKLKEMGADIWGKIKEAFDKAGGKEGLTAKVKGILKEIIDLAEPLLLNATKKYINFITDLLIDGLNLLGPRLTEFIERLRSFHIYPQFSLKDGFHFDFGYADTSAEIDRTKSLSSQVDKDILADMMNYEFGTDASDLFSRDLYSNPYYGSTDEKFAEWKDLKFLDTTRAYQLDRLTGGKQHKQIFDSKTNIFDLSPDDIYKAVEAGALPSIATNLITAAMYALRWKILNPTDSPVDKTAAGYGIITNKETSYAGSATEKLVGSASGFLNATRNTVVQGIDDRLNKITVEVDINGANGTAAVSASSDGEVEASSSGDMSIRQTGAMHKQLQRMIAQ